MSTKRFVGSLKIGEKDEKGNPTFIYPDNENLPIKQEWVSNSIWADNGKLFKPVNQHAIDELDKIIQSLVTEGYSCVHKFGSRKNTSIKYAIEARYDKFEFLK